MQLVNIPKDTRMTEENIANPVTLDCVTLFIKDQIKLHGDHTIKLMRKKTRKQFRHDISYVETAISKMIEQSVLNDECFINKIISKLLNKRVGVNKIKKQLYERGFQNQLITFCMSQIDPLVQLQNAIKLKESQFGTGKVTDSKIFIKAFRFLIGKGYESDIIKKVLDSDY
jgi:SOS response regulatory protein OraA/RecX